jgi:hypothetical protein
VQYLVELRRLVNSGRCFAVIGAGPSRELGLPSWKELAETVREQVKSSGTGFDEAAYATYMESERYPEVFSLAESDLGGLENLLALVRRQLVPKRPRGELYRFLARWPFACYLTTNFDDLLKAHLDDTGVAFTTLGNSDREFRKIRSDSTGIIVKLHGSLDVPDGVVLTSNQYAAFRSGPEREYYRRKLGSVFGDHDVLIVGYSLTDPDIEFVLEEARHYASAAHPVYMLAANVTQGVASELYRTKNIRVVSYPDSDGTHRALAQRLCPLMDRFFAPRVPGAVVLEGTGTDEDDTAASLYIYTQARLRARATDFVDGMLEALLLRALLRGGAVTTQSLIGALPTPGLAEDLRERAGKVVEGLATRGLLTVEAASVDLTETGRRQVEENQAQAELLRQRVEKQIELDFRREFPLRSETEARAFARAALQGLSLAMKRRGLSVAACVFAGAQPALHEGPDVFSMLHDASGMLEGFDQRAFYIDYLAGVISEPSPLFREYLAANSQGHFAFHALGFHPAAAKLRREWLDSTVWILDSSVLLPLLAKNCYEHSYAADLLARARDLGLHAYTTRSLFDEVVEHAQWARDCVHQYGTQSLEFMMIALLRGDYKQNLFIDGFIRTAAERPALTFDAYIASVLGDLQGTTLPDAVQRALESYHVQTIRFSDWRGFRTIDWGDCPYWAGKIREDREAKGTYRSEHQCRAEAEVLILLLGEREGRFSALGDQGPSRAYFVTQSGVLRRVFPGGECPVWSPEGLYRYLLLFPTEAGWDSDAIYDSMRSDLFMAGVPVIDKRLYAAFFDPRISESRIRMEEARQLFREGEAHYLDAYSRFYDSVPELEKPFYSLQVAWEAAEREKERADHVERKAPLTDKERAELLRLRVDKKQRERRAKHKRRSNEQRKARESSHRTRKE